VDVDIDQAGQQSAIAEIDGLRAIGMSDFSAGFDDAISADENFAGAQHPARLHIQQVGGVKNRGCLRVRSGQSEHEKKRTSDHLNHGYSGILTRSAWRIRAVEIASLAIRIDAVRLVNDAGYSRYFRLFARFAPKLQTVTDSCVG